MNRPAAAAAAAAATRCGSALQRTADPAAHAVCIVGPTWKSRWQRGEEAKGGGRSSGRALSWLAPAFWAGLFAVCEARLLVYADLQLAQLCKPGSPHSTVQ